MVTSCSQRNRKLIQEDWMAEDCVCLTPQNCLRIVEIYCKYFLHLVWSCLVSVTCEALLEKWLWLHYHLPILFCFTLLRDTLCCSADICYHSVDVCYYSKPSLQADCLIQAVVFNFQILTDYIIRYWLCI